MVTTKLKVDLVETSSRNSLRNLYINNAHVSLMNIYSKEANYLFKIGHDYDNLMSLSV